MTTNDTHWRTQLLARLGAERSYLLRQFWGLDEHTLSTIPVTDDWTAKDILAHIAFWDGLATERLSRMVNGRIHELTAVGDPTTIEATNRDRHTQFKELPLETTLAMLLKERSGFHTLLNRITDHDLHRRLRLGDGHRTRPRTWANGRWRHDAHHAQTLATWRQALPDDIKNKRLGPKYILRALLQTTRKEFLSTADLIPQSERTRQPVCGVWTLKDLIGHLTDWEKVGLEGLQQLANNQTPEFNDTIDFPFDAFNNANAAARQDQSWDEVWADFTTTRQQFLTQFDAMSDEQLTRQFTAPWQRPINGYFWLTIWLGHDHEHALDVRASLALPNWPQRLKH